MMIMMAMIMQTMIMMLLPRVTDVLTETYQLCKVGGSLFVTVIIKLLQTLSCLSECIHLFVYIYGIG